MGLLTGKEWCLRYWKASYWISTWLKKEVWFRNVCNSAWRGCDYEYSFVHCFLAAKKGFLFLNYAPLVEGGFKSSKWGSNCCFLSRWNFAWYENLGQEKSLESWAAVIMDIHRHFQFEWHTTGRYGSSLRSPWTSISKNWKCYDFFASFKLANGNPIFV